MKNDRAVQEVILQQASNKGIDPRVLAEKLMGKPIDAPKNAYYACGGCRREFYSEAEYLKHPCKRNSGNLDPRGLMRHMSTHGDRPPTMGGGNDSGGKQYGLATGELGEINDGGVEAELANVDMRLSATTELVEMKKKLSEAGVECNTLNKEQTELLFKTHFGLPEEAGNVIEDDADADANADNANADADNADANADTGKRQASAKRGKASNNAKR